MTRNSPRFDEFRKNLGPLIACVAGMMFGVAAIPFYTLGVFAGPVTAETGWTMQQYQTAFTFIIAGTLFGPILGHLCDKIGARPVAIISTIAFGLSLASLGLAANVGLYAFYAAWIVMAIVGQGTGPVIWTHIIGHRFSKNRGLAFGIVLAGSGIFAAFGPALAAAVIDGWGWQAAYALFGTLVILIPLPLIVGLLKPLSAHSIQSQTQFEAKEIGGLTLRAACGGYRFYLIGAAFLVIAFGVAGLITNMIPLLQSGGISIQAGSQLVGLVGVAVIAGRLIVGVLLDRLWAPAVAAIVLLCPAFACLLLLEEISSWKATIAVLLVGFAAGAEFDIVAFLASKYFGLKAYGKIYGILYIALFVGAAFSPPVFGWVLDVYGSYRPILFIFAVAIPVAALGLLALGRYPVFDD